MSNIFKVLEVKEKYEVNEDLKILALKPKSVSCNSWSDPMEGSTFLLFIPMEMSHFYVLKTALNNPHLSSQAWAAPLDQAECCHKNCSLLVGQISLWRKAKNMPG